MKTTALQEPASEVLAAVRSAAMPLQNTPADYSPLLRHIGNARFTLIGEASHGTHEFYRERAEITKRLILEKGYTAVVVEADWPDAYRLNRYVRGLSTDKNIGDALSGFTRFPTWLWRNTVIVEFAEWLREFNKARAPARRIGFYGMDLYSLFKSIQAVLRYLDRVDPDAAKRARYRYSCFDHAAENSQTYGYAAAFGMKKTCEDEVVSQLMELTRHAAASYAKNADAGSDELFHAEQNARLVRNAEEYYRTMFRGRVSSWNLRDQHMVETIAHLDTHLSRHGELPRIAVWAHNSHLGDASATEMGAGGEWNVGELMRKRYGGEAYLVGFSTYQGTVTAASDWDGATERKRVRAGLAGSYEELFHKIGSERFMLLLKGNRALDKAFAEPRLQRAIGVIYLPESERTSHYFQALLARQFDALIHLDETRALEPLELASAPGSEVPETYPSGI
jgi:erythromycin esterase-like protein